MGGGCGKPILNFQEHEGTLSASGIAFYVALSFFPLLLVLVAGLELDSAVDTSRAERVADAARYDRQSVVARSGAAGGADAPDGERPSSLRAGRSGSWCCSASAIAIFAQLDAAFDRTWRMPANPHASWIDWVKRLVFQRLKRSAC